GYLLLKGKNWKIRLIPLMTGFLILAVIFLPFFKAAGIKQVYYNLLGMNLSLHSYNLMANLLQKARATSQLITYYFFIWILIVPVLLTFIKKSYRMSFRERWMALWSREGVLWFMSLALLAVHTTAKIYQVSYQTVVMPLVIALTANQIQGIFNDASKFVKKTLVPVFIMGCMLTLISYGNESLSFINGKPVYFALSEQAEFVRTHSLSNQSIFTADSALVAVEADRDVLVGMAGSDLFPDWSRSKCEQYRVMNFEIMENYIKDRIAPVLVHGDRSFSLSLPYLVPIPDMKRQSLLNLINENYTMKKSYPNLFIPGTRTYYFIVRK
ncbi:hypothetical protein JW979_10825, partial [bacterium]|nr:hypothetical protein [candidate division CSSED10-310 bacterium]